jgi:hypothetical protein
VHSANPVHWLCIKGRIGYVNAVLKTAHAVSFVRAIRLDGNARDEYGGLGAFWRAAGSKNKDKKDENECFFHCGYGVKK